VQSARSAHPLHAAWYNPAVLLLAALATWLVLSALVALLVCLICRAGHAEDVARRYVEDRPQVPDRR
jgi:hypothetical protein